MMATAAANRAGSGQVHPEVADVDNIFAGEAPDKGIAEANPTAVDRKFCTVKPSI